VSVLDSADAGAARDGVAKWRGWDNAVGAIATVVTGGPIMNTIVVGTDGSQYAKTAMRWAADEAALHDSTLEAVLAWHYLDQHHPDHSDTFQGDYTEAHARAALAAWVTEALGDHATVDQRVICDLPVRALLEASDAADLLVLGARGTGGFEGLLFGSVSERVAQLATRPVAVIRAATPVGGGRVVVGIDGSARSLAALRWAAAEARLRDADVDVVHAWRLPIMAVPPATMALTDYAALEDSGRAVLDAALDEPDLAGLRVHPHFVHDSPGRALIERAEGAGLVVAGTRGLGRVSGALLGSVSRQLLHHAPCPVVVI
jgi:nucleotide-binding universal stress UspA family protein